MTKETNLLDKVPAEIQQAFWGVMGLLPWAALSRFLVHHQLVQLGRRRFWSRELVIELPTVIFCSLIGGGIASYYELDYLASSALVGIVSRMGPRWIEVTLSRYLDSFMAPNQTPNKKGESRD